MDLDQYKSQWQNSGKDAARNTQQLQEMLQLQQNRHLRRFRLKLIIESVVLLAFLLIFRDAFDGQEKPWLLNAILIVAILAVIGHNTLTYRAIHLGLQGNDLRQSLRDLSQRFSQHAWAGSLLMTLFHLSWISFIVYQLPLTGLRMVVIVVLLAIIAGAGRLTFRTWNQQARQMQEQLEKLEE